MTNYNESKPIQLSEDVFRLYQYACLPSHGSQLNTGLMVEDGCFDFFFIKEQNVELEIQGTKRYHLPPCFCIYKPPLPYKFIIPEKLNLFSIKIQPWISSFFSANEDCYVKNLNELIKNVDQLHSDIFCSNSFEEMVSCVENFFRPLLPASIEDYSLSKAICEQIYKTQGDIKIKDLMDQFPEYRQKINQIFQHQTHNTIKEFATYVRVRSALNYKIQNPKESLTQVGLIFGYFDQSHFIKDIKKTTGVTPSNFFKTYNLYSSQLK